MPPKKDKKKGKAEAKANIPDPVASDCSIGRAEKELIHCFDSIPIHCVHLTVIIGTKDTPTSSLPRILANVVLNDANKAVKELDVSAAFLKLKTFKNFHFAVERPLLIRANFSSKSKEGMAPIWVARIVKLAIISSLPEDVLEEMDSPALSTAANMHRNVNSYLSKNSIASKSSTQFGFGVRGRFSESSSRMNDDYDSDSEDIDSIFGFNVSKASPKKGGKKKAPAAPPFAAAPFSIHEMAREAELPLDKAVKFWIVQHYLVDREAVRILIEDLHVTVDVTVFIDPSETQRSHEEIFAKFGPRVDIQPPPVAPARRGKPGPKVEGPASDEMSVELTPKSRSLVLRPTNTTVPQADRFAQINAVQTDLVTQLAPLLIATAHQRDLHHYFMTNTRFAKIPLALPYFPKRPSRRMLLQSLVTVTSRTTGAEFPTGAPSTSGSEKPMLVGSGTDSRQPASMLSPSAATKPSPSRPSTPSPSTQRTSRPSTLSPPTLKLYDELLDSLPDEAGVHLALLIHCLVDQVVNEDKPTPMDSLIFRKRAVGVSRALERAIDSARILDRDAARLKRQLTRHSTRQLATPSTLPRNDVLQHRLTGKEHLETFRPIDEAVRIMRLHPTVVTAFDNGGRGSEANDDLNEKILDQHGRCMVYKGNIIDLAQRLNIIPEVMDRVIKQLAFKTFDWSFFENESLGCRPKFFEQHDREGTMVVKKLTEDIVDNVKAADRLLREDGIQGWQFHSACSFIQEVLRMSHSLPLTTFCKGADPGTCFLVMVPPFKASLVSEDTVVALAKTTMDFKTFRNELLPTMTAKWLSDALEGITIANEKSWVEEEPEEIRMSNELSATVRKQTTNSTVRMSAASKASARAEAAYDLGGRSMKLSTSLSTAFPFGGPQLKIERSQFQGDETVVVASLVDNKSDVVVCVHGRAVEETLTRTSVTATFGDDFVVASKNVIDLREEAANPTLANAVWFSYLDGLSVAATASTTAVLNPRARIEQSEKLEAAQRDLRWRMKLEEEALRAAAAEEGGGDVGSEMSRSSDDLLSSEPSDYLVADAEAEEDPEAFLEWRGTIPAWTIEQTPKATSKLARAQDDEDYFDEGRQRRRRRQRRHRDLEAPPPERRRRTHMDGTTVVTLDNGVVVILEPDGGFWCWAEVEYKSDLFKPLAELVTCLVCDDVFSVNSEFPGEDSSLRSSAATEGTAVSHVEEVEGTTNRNLNKTSRKKAKGAKNRNQVIELFDEDVPEEFFDPTTWLHVAWDGTREASFRGWKVDMDPLDSLTKRLYPDEYAVIEVFERIDGLKILFKENETVVSHHFDTTFVKTENLINGSVQMDVRCQSYASIAILQKPFVWRRVEHQVVVERAANNESPFALNNVVVLTNHDDIAFVEATHHGGTRLALCGDQGFYCQKPPIKQPQTHSSSCLPHFDNRVLFDALAYEMIIHTDRLGNQFLVRLDGSIQFIRSPPPPIASQGCTRRSSPGEWNAHANMHDLRNNDEHHWCLPWRCLLKPYDYSDDEISETETDTEAPDEELYDARWAEFNRKDALGKMLLTGHAPKLYFVKDEFVFEAQFEQNSQLLFAQLDNKIPSIPKHTFVPICEGKEHAVVILDPKTYKRSVVEAKKWRPFSWSNDEDLDKEFGFRLQLIKSLTSRDLRRLYGLTAARFIEENIKPKSYAFLLFVNNFPAIPPRPLDHLGNFRPGFGQPKARCTCYTQASETEAWTFCWMCCPKPADMRMSYWDQTLERIVFQLDDLLHIQDSENLWRMYREPWEIDKNEDRWQRNIQRMRQSTLEEWRRLREPGAEFGCYFLSDWKPVHLRPESLMKQRMERIDKIAKKLVAKAIEEAQNYYTKSYERIIMMEESRMFQSPSCTGSRINCTSTGSLFRVGGHLRNDSLGRFGACGGKPFVSMSTGLNEEGKRVSYKNRPSFRDSSQRVGIADEYYISERLPSLVTVPSQDSQLLLSHGGERFEVYPHHVIINVHEQKKESVTVELCNFTDNGARIIVTLPSQDELMIGNYAQVRLVPPKKFFLSPGMRTSMAIVYEPLLKTLPGVSDTGIIQRNIFIKFQPVQEFMSDELMFYGYQLRVKIAVRKNLTGEHLELVRPGVAVKMKQIKIDDYCDEDDDNRGKIKREWKACTD